jgi:hypothetical protein
MYLSLIISSSSKKEMFLKGTFVLMLRMDISGSSLNIFTISFSACIFLADVFSGKVESSGSFTQRSFSLILNL